MTEQSEINKLNAEEIEAKIGEITEALKAYGEANGLQGLEGRVQRGLDPAGMLAVPETRAKAEKIAQALGADLKKAEETVIKMHTTGPWEAGKMIGKLDENPDIKLWMILAKACTGDHSGDMSKEEFIKDTADVNARLDQAVANTDGFFTDAYKEQVAEAEGHFTMEDGVPVAETDNFKAMSIKGHEAGIVKDKSGILFVGSANSLDYAGAAEKLGLKKIEKEDRGRMSTFYVRETQDENGQNGTEDVIKELYPGFGIVLSGDMETAKTLARTGMKEKIKDVEGVRSDVDDVLGTA
jgi:hypothetical protein